MRPCQMSINTGITGTWLCLLESTGIACKQYLYCLETDSIGKYPRVFYSLRENENLQSPNLHSSNPVLPLTCDLMGNSTHVHVHTQARSTKTRQKHMRLSELPCSFFKIFSVSSTELSQRTPLYARNLIVEQIKPKVIHE